MHPSKALSIKENIEKLYQENYIYLIEYKLWVFNPIPIMKKQGTIHLSTNFYDLN